MTNKGYSYFKSEEEEVEEFGNKRNKELFKSKEEKQNT